MAGKPKIYEVEVRRDDRVRVVQGDLEYLKRYWGIPQASSIKVLLNKVQKQYEEREACCYNRTSVRLIG